MAVNRPPLVLPPMLGGPHGRNAWMHTLDRIDLHVWWQTNAPWDITWTTLAQARRSAPTAGEPTDDRGGAAPASDGTAPPTGETPPCA